MSQAGQPVARQSFIRDLGPHFEQIKKVFDLNVYLHVDEKVMSFRRLHRDVYERGLDNDDVEISVGQTNPSSLQGGY